MTAKTSRTAAARTPPSKRTKPAQARRAVTKPAAVKKAAVKKAVAKKAVAKKVAAKKTATKKTATGKAATGKAATGKTAAKQAASRRAAAATSAAAARTGKGRAPALLSGGNPQIAKGEGDAPVQAYIAAMPGWKRAVGRRLDGLIAEAVPKARKAVKWNSPFYGMPDDGWFLSFHCFDRYIKLAFFRGTSLRPLPPEASKTAQTRYLHIHEHEPFDEAQFVAWAKQASRLPGERM